MRRAKIGLAGTLVLYLFVFSGFAFSMFLYVGIGVLRYIWYPVTMVFGGYAGLLSIGYSILVLPLLIVASPFLALDSLGVITQTSMTPIRVAVFAIVSAGFVILLVSVATWLYYRLGGVRVVRHDIYGYSRHPQYLGLLLWCYVLLLHLPQWGSLAYTPPPALPYLVLLFTIIGVALAEEQELVERYGEEYISYREQTLFFIPLSTPLKNAILWTPRKITRKDLPETRIEVAKVLAVYLFIIATLSTPFDLLSH